DSRPANASSEVRALSMLAAVSRMLVAFILLAGSGSDLARASTCDQGCVSERSVCGLAAKATYAVCRGSCGIPAADAAFRACRGGVQQCAADCTTTTTATTTTTTSIIDCTSNPDGGPDMLDLTVSEHGSDLDAGWTGVDHNFPLVPNATLRMCLATCGPGGTPL